MKINGTEAMHIGFVGFIPPWEGEEMDIFDDLWGTPDGKRYVERYLQGDIVEYNWVKHGYIWTDSEIHKAAMGQKVFTISRPAVKITYGVKTVNGVRKTTDAKDAAAIFLYEKQAGNNPHWTVFPGDYEVRDFYSLNKSSGEFLVDEEHKMAMLFDNEEAAHNMVARLANEGELYSVYQGSINGDGFIAGIIDYECPYDDLLFYDDLPFYYEE